MSRLFATDYDLTAKRPVVWLRLVFIMGCLVWPLRVLSAHKRGCRAALRLRARYLLHNCCHLLWSKECCVCTFAFSQSVNSSGFSRRSPHWSFFWLSKITFWVDYTLSTASPNYSSVLRWPPNSHRSGVVSDCARCERGDKENRGQRNSQLHGFLEQTLQRDWWAAKHPSCIASPSHLTFSLAKLSSLVIVEMLDFCPAFTPGFYQHISIVFFQLAAWILLEILCFFKLSLNFKHGKTLKPTKLQVPLENNSIKRAL